MMKLQLQILSHHVILTSTTKLARACLPDKMLYQQSVNFRFYTYICSHILLWALALYDFLCVLKIDLVYKPRSRGM